MQSFIIPVAIFPETADTLRVDSFYGFPPSYRWSLGKTVVTQEAKPGIPAKGTPDTLGYVPAVDPVPEQTSYTELRCGNGAMTDAQWNGWTTQSDESYVLSCVATNLGVKLDL